MGFIRVMTYYHRRIQRLGFLKHLLWRASQSATNNLDTLGKDLIAAVCQKVPVSLSPQLREYIIKALTAPQYKALRDIATGDFDANSKKVQVEIQDVYLADSRLPSHRGKLVNDDWNKYPYLALELGLLRAGTYSLLVRGLAFLSLVSEEEKKAFVNMPNFSTGPFHINLPQRLLLLFSFIEMDGDILKGLYEQLITNSEPFADWEAGDCLPNIYRIVAKKSRPNARSGDDLLKVKRLLDTADKIESWKGKPYKGKGARDDAATIRLEPFVDLGLLFKPDPYAYRYQVTNATKTFFEPILNSKSIDFFLNNLFFQTANKTFGINAEHRTDRETILPFIQKAYTTLKSPLGYAPILMVSLLAGIYAITEKSVYFELSESLNALKTLQKEKPELVIFNVDRWGALTVVKFNDDITKHITRG